jgi:hypothetical protein
MKTKIKLTFFALFFLLLITSKSGFAQGPGVSSLFVPWFEVFGILKADSINVRGFSVDSLSVSGNIIIGDDQWIGIGASGANIKFDDQTTDEVIFSNCKLGIGVESPATNAALDVRSGDIYVVRSGVDATLLLGESTSGGYYSVIQWMDDEDLLRFGLSDGSINCYMAETGRFGFNTQSPGALLHLTSSSIRNDSLLIVNNARTGTDSTVTIQSNGYVGINCLPDSTFDVTGGARISNGLAVNNSTDITVATTVAGGEIGAYSQINHTTNALTGELIGVRGNARVHTIDSPSGTVIGGKFQAGNMTTGTDLSTATGVYVDVVNKEPSGATTWTNARGYEVSMDLNQGSVGNVNTVTNAYMFYGVYNLPTVDTYATVSNGYGVFIRNEAVGGTGQMIDAGFYLDDLNLSGGVKGWDYGIDFSGIGSNSGSFGSADIRLANGALLNNSSNTLFTLTEANIQLDGSVGIGVADPDSMLEVSEGVHIGRDLKVDGKITGQTVEAVLFFTSDTPSGISPDTLWCWTNRLGTTVTVDSIKASASTDDQDFSIVMRPYGGGAGTLIDALTISVDGVDTYTTTETTISNSSITANQEVGFVKPSVTSNQVKAEIFIRFTKTR